ncbi:MAG: FHA domain-containing protein [Lachnospiraceae bacterium]|nr:FHA domain-containing protein [Lachnospiraceae bacterium]
MKTEYKRDLQNNYLILEAPDVEAEENYGLRMAEQNQVKGLLPMHESRKDGKLYLHYEITSKQTLENVYEKKLMGYQDILSVLSDIRDTLETMRKYLLSPQMLLFAPEMIFMQPERKSLLLCYYAKENECPIRMLAEFILKRLDHRDRQAVALGYGFFERASGENFSLTESLKEILTTFGDTERSPRPDAPDNAFEQNPGKKVSAGYREKADSGRDYGTDFLQKECAPPYYGTNGHSRAYGETSGNTVHDAFQGTFQDTVSQKGRYDPPKDEAYQTNAQEEPYVIHRERSRKKGKGEPLTDRIFSRIHPAVLLSFLALTVVMEVLILCRAISLTEGGGCFFLILSVEILVNRRIFHKKTEKPVEWETEEENEEYRRLMQEVYPAGTEGTEPEPIEETRCLIPKEEDHSLRLICCLETGEKEKYPEIRPGIQPLYIGKIRGEADVLLNVSTVSRMHARIQMRQNQCFLKDMNSKNGTFLNGRRMEPQEECEIKEDDVVAFAQVTYRVVNV